MDNEFYMRRCLQLAANGKGSTSPNPMVGAVIVHNGSIIGEGFHVASGQPHAEVHAISSVKEDKLLSESTMYVNLEPCSHYGKTPPCARLIIEKKIPRVVIGCLDPNPKVSGNGVCMLREAGIDVTVGVLEKEARELNKRFICFQEKKRPYIFLKWAQSFDGYIDKKEKEPVVISDELNRLLVHKMRAEEDAVLIGTNTAVKDNPNLTVRLWSGKNPIRLLIDRSLRVPTTTNLYNGEAKTITFTEKDGFNSNVEYVKLDFSTSIIPQIMDELYKRNVLSVIVEGGRHVLQCFIDENLWDEARVEISDVVFGDGVEAPVIRHNKIDSITTVGKNRVVVYSNTK